MIATPTAARADVFGRLQFTVTDSETNKPLNGAVVTLIDSAGVSPNVQVVTDAGGSALTPPLENRAWRVATTSQSYNDDARTVAVAPDTTTPLVIKLNSRSESRAERRGLLVSSGQPRPPATRSAT